MDQMSEGSRLDCVVSKKMVITQQDRPYMTEMEEQSGMLPFASTPRKPPVIIRLHGAKINLPAVPNHIDFIPVNCTIQEQTPNQSANQLTNESTDANPSTTTTNQSKKRSRFDLMNRVNVIAQEITHKKRYTVNTSAGSLSLSISIQSCDPSLVYKPPSVSINLETPSESYQLTHFSAISACRVAKLIYKKKTSSNSYENIGLVTIQVDKINDHSFSFRPMKPRNWQVFVTCPVYLVMPVKFVLSNGSEEIKRHAFFSFMVVSGSHFNNVGDVNLIEELLEGELPHDQIAVSDHKKGPNRKKHKTRDSNSPPPPTASSTTIDAIANPSSNLPMAYITSYQIPGGSIEINPYRVEKRTTTREKSNNQTDKQLDNPMDNQVDTSPVQLVTPLSDAQNAVVDTAHCIGSFMVSGLVVGDSRFKRARLFYNQLVFRKDEREYWQVSICDRERIVSCLINSVYITCVNDKVVIDVEFIYPGINSVPSNLLVAYMGIQQHSNIIQLGLY